MAESRPPSRYPGLRNPVARVSTIALVGLVLLAALVQFGLDGLEGAAQRPLSGDEKRYVSVATAWAASEPAELDPLWPPGYPAVIALILHFGESLQWVVALQMVALLAAAVALAGIASEAGASPGVAWFAGALLVVDPEVAAYARLFWPEALHLALLLGALLLTLRSIPPRAEEGAGPSRLVALGVVLGLAIALKSLLLPLVPLVIVAVTASAPRWQQRLSRGLLVVVPLVVVVFPVILSHHSRSGVWGVSGSARFNLWVGLNDRSLRSLADDRTWEEFLLYREGGEDFAERQRTLTTRILELVESRGLPAVLAGQFPRQYFRLFDRESYFGAMLPPLGSRFLAGEGFREAPRSLARLFAAGESAVYFLILLAAPFGLARLLRERRRGALLLAPLLGYQLVLFYFLHVKARYRLSILPLLILGTVWAIETLRRRGREGESPISAVDAAAGCAGAALLFYFAYGAS